MDKSREARERPSPGEPVLDADREEADGGESGGEGAAAHHALAEPLSPHPVFLPPSEREQRQEEDGLAEPDRPGDRHQTSREKRPPERRPPLPERERREEHAGGRSGPGVD